MSDFDEVIKKGVENAFNTGRETQAKIDKQILSLSNSEILLMAGEMTAQELRTVRAVLNGLIFKIDNSIKDLPK